MILLLRHSRKLQHYSGNSIEKATPLLSLRRENATVSSGASPRSLSVGSDIPIPYTHPGLFESRFIFFSFIYLVQNIIARNQVSLLNLARFILHHYAAPPNSWTNVLFACKHYLVSLCLPLQPSYLIFALAPIFIWVSWPRNRKISMIRVAIG